MGRLVDRGDQFIFKPTETLSEEEAEQVGDLVKIFNDQNIGDFWQKREADIAAKIPEQTRTAQTELKSLLGDDYLTEEDVRRSCAGLAPKIVEAFVSLWKEGRIVPKGRNEYGEIFWAAE